MTCSLKLRDFTLVGLLTLLCCVFTNTSKACSPFSTKICTHSQIVQTACADENIETLNEVILFDNIATIKRDNLNVAQFGVIGFFKEALETLAIWASIKLTRWVNTKIAQRAMTYDYYYNLGNPGVEKAYDHWGDLLVEANYNNGNEPADHDVHTCPICSKQVNDLKN